MLSKKRIAAALAVCTALSVCAGCGTNKTSDSGSFETADKLYFAKANSYESAIGAAGDDYSDNAYSRYIYKKTGVRLEPVLLSPNSEEMTQQLAVKRAGGEKIDLLVGGDITQAWMQAKLIVPLDDFFKENKDKIKGWNPKAKNVIAESGWFRANKRGQYWGIPGRGVLNQAEPYWFYFRQDWLDKLGLKLPESTEELGEVLKAFTYNDPDGNGKNDTWGMCHQGSSTVNNLLLIMGVDSYREYIVNDKGDIDPKGKKLVLQSMHEYSRKQYSTIRDWCQNGYINKEGITDNTAYEKLISNNKIGVVLGTFNDVKKYTTALHDNGFADAEWKFCNKQIINSNDGKFYGFAPGYNVGTMTMLTSMTRKDKYDDIIKLLNWMYSKEGTTFQSLGLEGKEHNVDKDGNKVENAEYIKEKSYLGLYNFGKSYELIFPQQYDRIFGTDKLAQEYLDSVMNHPDEYATKRTDIKYEYPELEEFKTYPDWRKAIETYLLQFTVGNKDPMNDSDWNKYISECKGYGAEKLIDAAAKVYFGE